MNSIQKLLIQSDIQILDNKQFIVKTKSLTNLLESLQKISNLKVSAVKRIDKNSFLISVHYNGCKGCNAVLDNKRQYCGEFYCSDS